MVEPPVSRGLVSRQHSGAHRPSGSFVSRELCRRHAALPSTSVADALTVADATVVVAIAGTTATAPSGVRATTVIGAPSAAISYA